MTKPKMRWYRVNFYSRTVRGGNVLVRSLNVSEENPQKAKSYAVAMMKRTYEAYDVAVVTYLHRV